MKKTVTVAEVPGSKRTSDRIYTHAVIGQYNYDAQLLRDDNDSEVDESNWKYYSKNSKMKAGEMVMVTGCLKPRSYPQKQEDIDKGIEFITANPNKEEYISTCRAKRVAAVKANKEKGEGKWIVLRWSQSLANAQKSHSEFTCYKNITVVETQILEKKK